jgi:hypothetical protein
MAVSAFDLVCAELGWREALPFAGFATIEGHESP